MLLVAAPRWLRAVDQRCMPELGWPFGYPLLWLAMLALAGGMVLWFRRRDWL